MTLTSSVRNAIVCLFTDGHLIMSVSLYLMGSFVLRVEDHAFNPLAVLKRLTCDLYCLSLCIKAS